MDHGAAVPKTIFMELDMAAMRGLKMGQVIEMVDVRLSTYPDGLSGGHGVFASNECSSCNSVAQVNGKLHPNQNLSVDDLVGALCGAELVASHGI